MRLEGPGFRPGILQRVVTCRTAGDLCGWSRPPIGRIAGADQIFKHPRAHLVEPRIQFSFDLTQGGLGIGEPPGLLLLVTS